MSTPMYERVSRDQALREIRNILDDVGMSEEEFHSLGEQYLLNEHEYSLWRRLIELRWLSSDAS